MNEGIPNQNNTESEEERNRREEQDRVAKEMAAAYLEDHPELSEEREPDTSELGIRDEEERVRLVEEAFDIFEEKFPLERLFSLTYYKEVKDPLRVGAKELYELTIHPLCKGVEKTNVDFKKKTEIEERRKKISMAIGFVNSGKIRHE